MESKLEKVSQVIGQSALSMTWRPAWRPENRTCTCGKEFTIPPCWIRKNRGNDGTYCSLECRWKSKIFQSQRQKNKARNKVRIALKQEKIEKKECVVCGDMNTQAHHYKGYSDENLLKIVWFCKKHHQQEHERLRRLGLLEFL